MSHAKRAADMRRKFTYVSMNVPLFIWRQPNSEMKRSGIELEHGE